MYETLVGACLIIAGVAIFLFGRRRSKQSSVRASDGSVAVGGNNSGSIRNTALCENLGKALFCGDFEIL